MGPKYWANTIYIIKAQNNGPTIYIIKANMGPTFKANTGQNFGPKNPF